MFRPISSQSLEYVPAVVAFKKAGVWQDISGDTVQMAFIAMTPGQTPPQPQAGDFKAAVWDVDTTTNPATYTALCLVGTGGTITLAAGQYAVWVKVTDNPEHPALYVDMLTVT